VRPPGFEPGSSAWQADVLAKLDYGRIYTKACIFGFLFPFLKAACIMNGEVLDFFQDLLNAAVT
jgi:hypothetical protein